ncbi:MAG: hypothetical protein KVP17_004980 [Porospora cf. gigantea B]|uniref:uncharacterized protein n=2 Tax=Porospora cf. gigantea B TaxID=2853592 RepID=UPI003571B350|nr:MAG: hypothetical protein KVP17_004980 [Porospora cf. gigantea B]
MGQCSSCLLNDPQVSSYQDTYTHLRERLKHQSLPVVIPLSDGTNLDCLFGLIRADGRRQFVLSTPDRIRQIPLDDLTALLTTPDELQRVDTEATITADVFVALRLKKGNCVPIRFSDEDTRNIFIDLVRHLKPSI